MHRIAKLDQATSPTCQWVGVCISPVTPDQRHLGIIYREVEHGKLSHIHLAWHHMLTSEDELPSGLLGDPSIHPARLRQVAAMCRKIWRQNGRAVPYAFSDPEGIFNPETGKILLGDTRYGLTCSSFVLAVFFACGLRIVNVSEWPNLREGDNEWQEFILGQLSRRLSGDELRNVESQKGFARFRPEEVIAAAVQFPHPRSCEQVRELSLEIIDAVNGRSRTPAAQEQTTPGKAGQSFRLVGWVVLLVIVSFLMLGWCVKH